MPTNILKKAKKLILILVISILVTKNSKEAISINAQSLKQIIYIQYFIAFQGNLTQVGKALDLILAFFNLSSKINIIYLIFIEKLGLAIQFTNIGT